VCVCVCERERERERERVSERERERAREVECVCIRRECFSWLLHCTHIAADTQRKHTQGIAFVSLHRTATQHTATRCTTQGIAFVSLHRTATQHTATHRVSPSDHNSTSLIHTNDFFMCVTPDSKVTRLIRA